MAYASLGSLRSRLRNRLGYASAGAAAGVNEGTLNDFLVEAQVDLYLAADWARLRAYVTKNIGASQYLIDYPVGANPDRIKAISVLRSNVWSKPLAKGITPQDYTNQASPSFPQKWEPYQQIELWPITDQAYSLRIFYVIVLGNFVQDGDLATIDSDLIFKLALGRAKAHYRQPDSALYLKGGEELLSKLKAKSWGQTVFNPNDYSAQEPLVKPQVISTLGY